jgi:hypothetical protein
MVWIQGLWDGGAVTLPVGGLYKLRKSGEAHAFEARLIHTLHLGVAALVSSPRIPQRGFLWPSIPCSHTHCWAMKRASSLSALLDCSTPWLTWWQEIILTWVASWHAIGTLVITSPDGEYEIFWDMPSDIELQRMELEELLDVETRQREG